MSDSAIQLYSLNQDPENGLEIMVCSISQGVTIRTWDEHAGTKSIIAMSFDDAVEFSEWLTAAVVRARYRAVEMDAA